MQEKCISDNKIMNNNNSIQFYLGISANVVQIYYKIIPFSNFWRLVVKFRGIYLPLIIC
jgi:hypothetical protein